MDMGEVIIKVDQYINANPERILKIILEYSGFKENQLFSKSRKKELVDFRFCYMIALSKIGMRIDSIAELTGKDRCTVLHALKQSEVNEIKFLYNKMFSRFKILKLQ